MSTPINNNEVLNLTTIGSKNAVKVAKKEANKAESLAKKDGKKLKKLKKQLEKEKTIKSALVKKLMKKWQKDPNMPKGARNGFILYCLEMREGIKTKYPEKKMTERQKIMGQNWSNLSVEEKAPWFSKAVADKERANKAKVAYKKTLEHFTWKHTSYCQKYLSKVKLALLEDMKDVQEQASGYDEYANKLTILIDKYDQQIEDMLLEKIMSCKSTTYALEMLYINIGILKEETGIPQEGLLLDALNNLKAVISASETSTVVGDVYEFVTQHEELDPVDAFIEWMDRMRELSKLTKQVGDYLGDTTKYEILYEAVMQKEADIICKLQDKVFTIFCDQVTKEATKGARQDLDFDKAAFVHATCILEDLLADNAPDNLIDEVDWEPYAEEIMEKIEDLEILDMNNEISEKQISVVLRALLSAVEEKLVVSIKGKDDMSGVTDD